MKEIRGHLLIIFFAINLTQAYAQHNLTKKWAHFPEPQKSHFAQIPSFLSIEGNDYSITQANGSKMKGNISFDTNELTIDQLKIKFQNQNDTLYLFFPEDTLRYVSSASLAPLNDFKKEFSKTEFFHKRLVDTDSNEEILFLDYKDEPSLIHPEFRDKAYTSLHFTRLEQGLIYDENSIWTVNQVEGFTFLILESLEHGSIQWFIVYESDQKKISALGYYQDDFYQKKWTVGNRNDQSQNIMGNWLLEDLEKVNLNFIGKTLLGNWNKQYADKMISALDINTTKIRFKISADNRYEIFRSDILIDYGKLMPIPHHSKILGIKSDSEGVIGGVQRSRFIYLLDTSSNQLMFLAKFGLVDKDALVTTPTLLTFKK